MTRFLDIFLTYLDLLSGTLADCLLGYLLKDQGVKRPNMRGVMRAGEGLIIVVHDFYYHLILKKFWNTKTLSK